MHLRRLVPRGKWVAHAFSAWRACGWAMAVGMVRAVLAINCSCCPGAAKSAGAAKH
ncbi:MAG: hypothetical protein MUC60_16410 [Oscillatoria sp. Prado101]|nr:hypothetical protein [Oscillatoria sp. Prado101]